jgi:hypothetical protein
MGLFYLFINDSISNNQTNEYVHNLSQKPCGRSDCCSLHPHLKQQMSVSSPTFFNNTTPSNKIYPTPINAALSMNNSNNSQTSTIKRNRRQITPKKNRPTTRSQKYLFRFYHTHYL